MHMGIKVVQHNILVKYVRCYHLVIHRTCRYLQVLRSICSHRTSMELEIRLLLVIEPQAQMGFIHGFLTK